MEHRFSLTNRNQGAVSGVEKLVSFDTDQVVLLTEGDTLVIKGQDMHVTRLDVEKGELEFAGTVDGFQYTQKKSVKAAGVLGRLFQ
jgi:sporulation protein YabP